MYLGKECNITSTEDGRLQLRYFDYEDIRGSIIITVVYKLQSFESIASFYMFPVRVC